MFNAVLATIGVSLVSLIGAVLMLKKKFQTITYGGVLVSMAAGVMLATAVLDLLPEAIEGYGEKEIFWALLAGICLFFVMERLIHWYHHHGHTHAQEKSIKPTAYLILLGDALHNFFDGIAIATAFSVSNTVGVATTIAVILHEIPQELADFVALVHSGVKFWKALFFNLISALTAVLGVVVGWMFLSSVSGTLPFLLAFTAGMFVYISCSDLIPALHEDFKRDRKWLQTVTFLLGVIVMAVMLNFLHEAEHGEEKLETPGRVYEVESHLEAEAN
jgi:zinc and cadmium transporter